MGRFERDGLAFNYEEMGDPEAPPVVFLHDHGGESRDWFPVMQGLQRNYHLVAPDLRGHGLSAAPEGVEAYDLGLFEGDLGVLLDYLGAELAALVGLGLGGAVALQFAVNQPERVAALCLVDTSPAFASDRFAPEAATVRAELEGLEELVRQRGTRALGRDRARSLRDPRLASALLARAAAASVDGWLGAARALRERADLAERLGESLTMPVMICGGEDDPAQSAFEVLRAEVIGARSITFRDVGRGAPLYRSEKFVRVLKTFLQDVEDGHSTGGVSTV